MGTTAAAKAMLSRSGVPESLSMSGNMPETPHRPPANEAGGPGHAIHQVGRPAVSDAQESC